MTELTGPLPAPLAPIPNVDEDTVAFWRGGADGRLMITRCQDCGYYLHPPMPICSRCLSVNVKPEAVSGKAALASYTINYQPWAANMKVPFIIGLVELVEQPSVRLTTNIVETPVERVAIGMKLTVLFAQRDDVWLPHFKEDVAA